MGVHLHAVGVVPVATVVGAERGLDVGHVPGLGAQGAQGGGRVGGTGAHFFTVRLPHQTAVVGPVFLQRHNDLLEVERLGHG